MLPYAISALEKLLRIFSHRIYSTTLPLQKENSGKKPETLKKKGKSIFKFLNKISNSNKSFNEEKIPLNQQNQNFDLTEDPESALFNKKSYENPNNSQGLITENLSKKEQIEKDAKISRFAMDYSRASPNITLRQKNPISIGWRNSKYHFDVLMEITNSLNYSTENVTKFLIF